MEKLPITKIDGNFDHNGSEYEVEYLWEGKTLMAFIKELNEPGIVQHRFEVKFEALGSANPNIDASLSRGLTEFLMENLIQGYGKRR